MSGDSAIRKFAAANNLKEHESPCTNINPKSTLGLKLQEALDLGITHCGLYKDSRHTSLLILAKKNKPDQVRVTLAGASTTTVSGFTIYALKWTGSEFVGVW